MASTDVNALVQVANALPQLRRDLLQPGNLRRLLLREGYPSRSLPELEAPGAQLELYRRMQAHAALAEHLPQRPTTRFIFAPGGVPTLLPVQDSERYFLSDNCALHKSRTSSADAVKTRCAALYLARNKPVWNLLDVPAGWSMEELSPNGRWAYVHESTDSDSPSRTFRLFDLSLTKQPLRFSASFCGDRPSFAVNGQALLFTDEDAGRLRLNRLDLRQEALPVARHTTSYRSLPGAAYTTFSPRGHRAFVASEAGAHVYHLGHSAPPTELSAEDLDDEFKRLVWRNGEDQLHFFYPDSQRATTFLLDSPVAQRRPFVAENNLQCNVQACYDDRLLTVRPQGEGEVWQLYTWDGKAASAPVTLPHGRRNHEDRSELVGSRALLAQDRHPNMSAGALFFVDFAEADPRPLALSSDFQFALAGDAQTDSAWIVGMAENQRPSMYALVNTGSASHPRGHTVQLLRAVGDSFRVRADGQAMLVGRPGVGLLVYGL